MRAEQKPERDVPWAKVATEWAHLSAARGAVAALPHQKRVGRVEIGRGGASGKDPVGGLATISIWHAEHSPGPLKGRMARL